MRGVSAQFLLPVVVLALATGAGALAGSGGGGFSAGLALSALTAVVLGVRARAVLRRAVAVLRGAHDAGLDDLALNPVDELGAVLRASADTVTSNAARTTALQRQLGRQTLVLDRMTDGLMRVDDDLRVTWTNIAAGTLFGGRNPTGRSFVSVTRDHELLAAVKRCLATGEEQQHTIEIAGEGRLLSAIVIRVDARPAEALVILRDITEANRLQHLRRDFVANVSHELRTPLSTIKILTETLLDVREHDEEAAGFLRKIDAEVDSMTELVRDLLDLTRLESPGGQLSKRQLDAGQLAKDVAGRMRPLADRQGVMLVLEPPSSTIDLHADERRLHQALINLVTNAIAHTPAGGIVTLAVSARDGMVEFVVRDTGSGIASSDLPRIWERFFKTDRARAEPGTGLGLAIVKHIAQAHQGTVGAASEPGSGSTFTIAIPASVPRGGRLTAAASTRVLDD